jgi:hypothetical protein
MPTDALACESLGGCAAQPVPWLRLDGLHHTLPQEPDARPSIALTLEQLQTVDMALDGTMAPGQREPCCDRREILLQALGKTGKRLHPARGRLGHPRGEGVAPARSHERQKGLAQGRGLRDCGGPRGQLVHIQLSVRRPLHFGAHPGERAGPRCWPLWAGGG